MEKPDLKGSVTEVVRAAVNALELEERCEGQSLIAQARLCHEALCGTGPQQCSAHHFFSASLDRHALVPALQRRLPWPSPMDRLHRCFAAEVSTLASNTTTFTAIGT